MVKEIMTTSTVEETLAKPEKAEKAVGAVGVPQME
jgi:hypothetical protein